MTDEKKTYTLGTVPLGEALGRKVTIEAGDGLRINGSFTDLKANGRVQTSRYGGKTVESVASSYIVSLFLSDVHHPLDLPPLGPETKITIHTR